MYAAADTAQPTRTARTDHPAERPLGARRGRRSSQGGPWGAVGLFLLVATSLIAVGALPTLADSASTPTATHAVTVGAADTLWSIAKDNRVAGVPTAEMVEAIRRLNGLTSGQGLQPGALVKVPIVEDHGSSLALR